MGLATSVRRWVPAWVTVAGVALGTVAGPQAAQAAPGSFDPRNGEVTVGEIVTLVEKDLGRQLGDPALALALQSERAPSERELDILLRGGEVPGFTVLGYVEAPRSDLSLRDLGLGTAAKGAKTTVIRVTISIAGVRVVIECEFVDHGDGWESGTCFHTVG